MPANYSEDGDSSGTMSAFVLLFFPRNANRCSSEIKLEEITRSDGKITGPVCGDYEHVSDSGTGIEAESIFIRREWERERERERGRVAI